MHLISLLVARALTILSRMMLMRPTCPSANLLLLEQLVGLAAEILVGDDWMPG